MSAQPGEPEEIAYVEERGPGIPELPDTIALGGEPAPELPGVPAYPGWEEKTVEQFLMGFGAGTHMLIGVADHDWQMTEKDLERIAPPLTRILNRWEPAVRVSPYADPLLVAHGFGLYGWRSALERQRALRDAQAEQEIAEGTHGYETGPSDDVEVPEGPQTYFPREEQQQ